jgi:hypothetical protein
MMLIDAADAALEVCLSCNLLGERPRPERV